MLHVIDNVGLKVIDFAAACIPRRRPPRPVLARAKIVAHRGAHDNRRVRENTLPAFDALLGAGVWGLECDLRWTRDLEPVVCHDPDLKRVFGIDMRVADHDYAALRAACPELPHLREIVERYGGRLHLMLEIKAEHYPHPDAQTARLATLLAALEPARDFHILALEMDLYRHVQQLPSACWLPVARLNTAAISAFAAANGCGGFAAPYFAVSARQIARHRAAGRCVGVGFPSRRNLLYGELARGVDWIFSNHALRLQQYLT